MALINGASRGIGRTMALLLAQKGYTVMVNYHHSINATTEVINAIVKSDGKATALRTDISDETQVMAILEAVDRVDGPLTALASNTGILFTQCTVRGLGTGRINRVLATNITDYFLCCREAVERIIHRCGGKGGAMVNVSSVASRLGAPGGYVDYVASKGAVDTLTTRLALEVAAQGVRVSGMRLGLIYTKMHASGGEPGHVDRVKNSLPMQCDGQPGEVAQTIAWLLSDRASYVTDSFLELAGGK